MKNLYGFSECLCFFFVFVIFMVRLCTIVLVFVILFAFVISIVKPVWIWRMSWKERVIVVGFVGVAVLPIQLPPVEVKVVVLPSSSSDHYIANNCHDDCWSNVMIRYDQYWWSWREQWSPRACSPRPPARRRRRRESRWGRAPLMCSPPVIIIITIIIIIIIKMMTVNNNNWCVVLLSSYS